MPHDLPDRRVANERPVRAQEGDGEVHADDALRVADRVELCVEEVARRGAERVRVRVGRDERRLRKLATSQNPASFRWERSTRMPSRLQARTRSRPAAVRPAPVSGDDGKRNGTPSAKAFGRDQTSPIERRPRSYHSRDSTDPRRSARRLRDARSPLPARLGSRRRLLHVDRKRCRASRRARLRPAPLPRAGSASASGTAYGVSVGSGVRGRGDVQREEAAGESRGLAPSSRSRCSVGSPRQRLRTRSLWPSMITAASYGRLWQAPAVAETPLRVLIAEDDAQLAELVERHPRRRRTLHHRRPRIDRRRSGSALRRAGSRHGLDGHRDAGTRRHRSDARDPCARRRAACRHLHGLRRVRRRRARRGRRRSWVPAQARAHLPRPRRGAARPAHELPNRVPDPD